MNGNEARELQKRAQDTDKKVQGNINDIKTFAQRTEKAEQGLQEGNRQIQDIKKKFEKQSKDVVQLQNDVRATDKKATKALNDSKANTTKISQLEKSGSISKIKNSFASLRRDFGSNNQTLEASVGSLRTNLDSSILNFKNTDQGVEQRLQSIQSSVNTSFLNFGTKEDQLRQSISINSQSIDNINNQLNVAKVDFASSIDTVVADNRQDKESILALSQNVDELKKNELADEKARQKDLRIGAADKRREIKENILEGSKKALATTGQALARSTNSLLGGFNLLDAIKSVLSKLALGLLIVKFPEIYKNITANIEEWKRVAALFIKNFLRPVKAFFGLIVDVGIKLVKWIFKGVNLVRKAIGAIIGFTFNAGKKLIGAVVRFLGKLFDAGKSLLRPGGRAAGEAAAQAAQRGGSSAASDVAGNKNFLQRASDFIGSGLKTIGGKAYEGISFVDDKLTGGKVTTAMENSVSNTKKLITEGLNSIKGKFGPVKNAISTFKSGVGDAIKQGPEAFKKYFGTHIAKIGSAFSGIMGVVGPTLNKLGPLVRTLGKIPGADKFISGIGRSNPLLTFPIDYLLNKFLLGQDDQQAIQRAIGSTAGSAIGSGLGLAVGGPFAPLTSGIGGFVGGELGDYFAAQALGYGTKGTTVQMVKDMMPSIKGWFDGDIKPENNGSGEPMGKISPSSPATGSSGTSGFQNNNTAIPISPSPSSQAAATVPVSQYLRKPIATASSSSMGSTSASGTSPSMAQISLPPQTVDMPTQVVGDKGESLDKTPAQSIPSISPSNPAMDYLQIAAANTFEMQLV